MKQIIYLGGKKARNYTAPHEETDVIGDCDWKEGEIKTEGVDYFITYIGTEVKNIIPNYHTHIPNVPIPKKQEGDLKTMTAEQIINRFINEEGVKFDQERDDWMIEAMEEYAAQFKSAATPPDVEQLRSDLVDILYECNGTGAGADDVVKYLISKDLQAGQSAVRDATPQEELEWETLDATDYKDVTAFYFECFYRTDRQAKAFQKELSTLRSELSAAQEENKRLREAIEMRQWEQDLRHFAKY